MRRRRPRLLKQSRAAITTSLIIERERRNLQRAYALLDCLRVAVMYDEEQEIDAGDVAYVVRGLVSDGVNALDCVELRRAARQHSPEPP